MSLRNKKGPRPPRLRGEDKARLVSYALGVAWPIAFLLFPPPSYSIVSDLIIHLWMFVGAVGALGAMIGVITRIDMKLELPSLYFVLVAPLLYFSAQIGFILQGEFHDRFALAIFVLWHTAMLIPRIVNLESIRRHEHLRRRSV